AWFSQPRSDGDRIDWHTRNIAKLSGSMLPRRDSQIEAVCADGARRVLLLQETPARVELIDTDALKVVASIDLAVEGRGEIARAWSEPEGVAGRRDGAAARRAFARRQGEEAGGLHRVRPATFALAGLGVRGGALADGERWPIAKGHHRFVAL